MSITALPVIAKILMDLQLFRSDVGMVIVAAAIVNDIAGWLIFAFLLGLMGHAGGERGPADRLHAHDDARLRRRACSRSGAGPWTACCRSCRRT